jgi:transketolase
MPNTSTVPENLPEIAAKIRGKIVSLSHVGGAPHLGSSLSCADIVTALYWTAKIDPQAPLAPTRDRIILSKGHAATTLYSALAYRGFFPLKTLDSFNTNGGVLQEHPAPQCVPGVEVATGSLGHGLSLGVGMALAARIKKQDCNTYVVMSDGECNEGSVWEAAMMAPRHKLERLMVFIDFNKWQATGRSQEVSSLDPLVDKWSSFGWDAREIDGHDMQSIVDNIKSLPTTSGKPVAIIAHTVKGKGVSFMEDDNNWHYRIPTEDEVALAHKELGLV